MTGKQKIAYFYDPEVGNYYYGQGHPMKPHRIRMTNNLVMNYGLYDHLQVYQPQNLEFDDFTKFHSDEYIDFLQKITPDHQHEHSRQLKKFNVGEDCPVFDGLYQFCQTYGGGSLGAAHKLNQKSVDMAVNWAGGLHHAKKSEASGFCYVNDIVLAILELLKYHQRVLYVDIDIHHGDGVEEAFYTTDRVMTVSFHKFGEGYFPGTGHQEDVGFGAGRYYTLNVPLQDGIDDQSYEQLFKPIMRKVMERYRPDAIVFQAGTDSLSGDRLGCFNLSIKGHSECLKFMQSFGVPLLLLGGGGYTIRNVARCWCYETACLAGVELDDKLPDNDYYAYFGPNFRLHIQPSNMLNRNDANDLEKIRNTLLERLNSIKAAPSVRMRPQPDDAVHEKEDDEQDPERSEGPSGKGKPMDVDVDFQAGDQVNIAE